MFKPLFAAQLIALATLVSACAVEEETDPPLQKAADSTCELQPPAQPVVCTMEWDPVCGCDGKTYGNACAARGAGVPTTVPGACEDTSQ